MPLKFQIRAFVNSVLVASSLGFGVLSCSAGPDADSYEGPARLLHAGQQLTGSSIPLTLRSSSGQWVDLANAANGSTSATAHTPTGGDVYIEYSLGGRYTLSGARLYEDNAGSWKVDNWKLQYWTGSAFVDAFPLTPSPLSGWNEVSVVAPVTTDAVRFVMQEDTQVEVYELAVYGEREVAAAVPSAQYPALIANCSACSNGGSYLDMNQGSTLFWSPVSGGSSGGSAQLYFSLAAPFGRQRTVGVFVNGTRVGSVSTTSPRPTLVESGPVTATLLAGNNRVELRDSEGLEEPDVAYLRVQGASAPPPPPPPVGTAVKVGLLPGSKYNDMQGYEQALGLEFNHRLMFQPVKSLSMSGVKRFLDLGYEVELNIEFQDSFPNLDEVRDGLYDSYLIRFADALAVDGRLVWLRPLHEFNGDWYNWGVFSDASHSTQDFKDAWIHVVDLFRSRGANVKFQLNYNQTSAQNSPIPFSEFYPGDAYVDLVAVSSYNRAGTTINHQTWRTFEQNFQRPYDLIRGFTTRPIGIAEMSTTSNLGGDKPAWIRNAFAQLSFNFPAVERVTWFLFNKNIAGELGPRDWDLNTAADEDAFIDGFNQLAEAR